MRFILIVFLFFLSVFSSCNYEYSYWPIAKFHIDDKALSEREKVRVIYSSRGGGEHRDAYVHVIVVSNQTGDTVNVLTSVENDFKKEDGNKEFIFISQYSDLGKIVSMHADKLKEMHLDTLKNIKPATYDKVLRDPKFDYLADNNFMSIFGFIGEDTPADSSKAH